MNTAIPPLFRGEVLIPSSVKAALVDSTITILGRFVLWDAAAGRFRARPSQPDLCILPQRSAPIAAAGFLAFAQKHDLPIPACLAVDGVGQVVYGAYERAHSHYAELWCKQPEEFARLKAVDIEHYGEERSFLNWLDQVTGELDEYDGFSFGNLYFLDPSIDSFDEWVGGYYRFVEAQTSEYAPPNAARTTLDQIRAHPGVTAALAAKGKARLTMIDDATSSGETHRVHAPTVLKSLGGEGITYAAHEALFVFPPRFDWLTEIEESSLAGIELTKHEDILVYQMLIGSSRHRSAAVIGAIPTNSVVFDTPAAIEAYARFLTEDGDLLAELQAHVGIVTRDELMAQLLQMAPNLRAAIVAAVDEAEPAILDALRCP